MKKWKHSTVSWLLWKVNIKKYLLFLFHVSLSNKIFLQIWSMFVICWPSIGFSGHSAGHLWRVPQPHRLHGGVRHVPHPLQALHQGLGQAQDKQLSGKGECGSILGCNEEEVEGIVFRFFFKLNHLQARYSYEYLVWKGRCAETAG